MHQCVGFINSESLKMACIIVFKMSNNSDSLGFIHPYGVEWYTSLSLWFINSAGLIRNTLLKKTQQAWCDIYY